MTANPTAKEIWTVLADPKGMFIWDIVDRSIPPDLKCFKIFQGENSYEKAKQYIKENESQFNELWFSKY